MRGAAAASARRLPGRTDQYGSYAAPAAPAYGAAAVPQYAPPAGDPGYAPPPAAEPGLRRRAGRTGVRASGRLPADRVARAVREPGLCGGRAAAVRPARHEPAARIASGPELWRRPVAGPRRPRLRECRRRARRRSRRRAQPPCPVRRADAGRVPAARAAALGFGPGPGVPAAGHGERPGLGFGRGAAAVPVPAPQYEPPPFPPQPFQSAQSLPPVAAAPFSPPVAEPYAPPAVPEGQFTAPPEPPAVGAFAEPPASSPVTGPPFGAPPASSGFSLPSAESGAFGVPGS